MTREAREHSFDALARGLASGSISRGRALKLMGAALVGGTLASLGIGEAAADPPGCKRNGKKCKRDPQCCSGKCEGGKCACTSNGGTCTSGAQCCSGNCFIQFGRGFCLPPRGPNIIDCDCVNETGISMCSSAACGSDDVHHVCVALCAPSGGVAAERCAPEAICGAS
jgi:hypothetical protein